MPRGDAREWVAFRAGLNGLNYVQLVQARDNLTRSAALRYLLGLGVKADMEAHPDRVTVLKPRTERHDRSGHPSTGVGPGVPADGEATPRAAVGSGRGGEGSPNLHRVPDPTDADEPAPAGTGHGAGGQPEERVWPEDPHAILAEAEQHAAHLGFTDPPDGAA